MRVTLIADTHLSARSPECAANWHAARRAVERLRADLTVNLGDITLDGQTHTEEPRFASPLIQLWPTEMRCLPGSHDLSDGSGELPLDARMLGAYRDAFGPDHGGGERRPMATAGHRRATSEHRLDTGTVAVAVD